MYLDRDEACKRIRVALKRKTGKTWSVSGGRGTGYGWITVAAPPARRICHEPNPAWDQCDLACKEPPYLERQPAAGEEGWYTSDVERAQLGRAFKLNRPVHMQGLSISPDEREFYVLRAES